jgi:sensor domain CHASE-containing protein
MVEIYIAVGAGILILIGVVVSFWNCAYENGKLKELVKQKEEEIERMKRDQRICGDY